MLLLHVADVQVKIFELEILQNYRSSVTGSSFGHVQDHLPVNGSLLRRKETIVNYK